MFFRSRPPSTPATALFLFADNGSADQSHRGCPAVLARPLLSVLLAAVAGMMASVGSQVWAAAPVLRRAVPPGLTRGSEADLLLQGERLDDAQEVLFYKPGITVQSLSAESADRVKLRLSIAPDCPVGEVGLRLRTATGISNLITVAVGSLPIVDEAEPNGKPEEAQSIPWNVTVHGTVLNEDVDYFRVEGKAGEVLSVEVEGLRLGESFFDPYLAVTNERRFVLAAVDDHPVTRQDACLSVKLPEDGVYFIELRESAFGGSEACRYRLHVGRFPRPTAVFPTAAKPGESLRMEWRDGAGETWEQEVSLPSDAAGTVPLFADRNSLQSPSPNWVRVTEWDRVAEAEPNDADNQAVTFTPPAVLCGRIVAPGDVDRFRFSAKKGEVWDVRVYARELRSPLDSVLNISRATGQGVAGNDDAVGPDSQIRFTAPDDGEYVLSIRDQLLDGSPDHVYCVEVAPARPQLVLSLPERTVFNDITVAVPRGNRLAMMVAAQRVDFDAETVLRFGPLPDGMSVQADNIPAGVAAVPVLISADESAEPNGRLVELIGQSAVGDLNVEGRLRQRTSLIRGQNDREIWNYTADRFAAAVTAPAPFSLEIVQPKVPIVQGGTMRLKVAAKRDEGFKAPIQLQMLYNPPGLSTPTSVTLPGDTNEVVVPITATAQAAIGRYKVAVLGTADVGNGTVTVSTQLAELEVAAPFFAFEFPSVALEQGQGGAYVVRVHVAREFPGEATAELVGLPPGVSVEPQTLTKDTTELKFALQTSADSPPGQHKSLRCVSVVTLEGEPIEHLFGPGELVIQKPAPPKADAPAPAQPAPQPAAPALSRLEQLRQKRQAVGASP
ncbi:MAG: PPC domain-containing protein [Thermogutta sp.]